MAEQVRAANVRLERIYGWSPLDAASIAADYYEYARMLAPFLTDTDFYIYQRLKAGNVVLAEGAQGTLLDLDMGTYPFVTSTSATSAAAFLGLGIGPAHAGRIIGATKVFQTRVGEGPFPTEVFGAEAERLRGTGTNPWDEFGTTTGRPRRCGWLDLVLLRYAVRVNGITELVLTKMDVLSGLEVVRYCAAYEIEGQLYDKLPVGPTDLKRCRPVYESLPGWCEDLSGARVLTDLPIAARQFVQHIERLTEVPVSLISVGSERTQIVHTA